MQNTNSQWLDVSRETLDLTKQALAGIRKSGISVSPEGLTGYDLTAPSLKLFPALSPLRNRIPRIKGVMGSTAAHWKAITGINTANLKASVAFGTRNSAITYTTADKSATYKSLGLDNNVEFEAVWQAQGWEDIRATAALTLLQSVMIEEEKLILGGNCNLEFGTCGNPTIDVSATGGVTAVTNTVKIVPLNLFGYLGRTVDAVTGVCTAIPIGAGKGAAGSTADGTNVTNKKIVATWTAVRGAVAYAVYVGVAAGPFYLQDVVTVNAWNSGTGALTTSGQAYSALTTPGSDLSRDSNDFDGIISQLAAADSGAYVRSFDGAALSADNAGGVTELDTLCRALWDNRKIGPTLFVLNAQEAQNITKKVAGSTGSGTGFRVMLTPGADQKGLTGSFYCSGYLNKFTSSATPGNPDIVPFLIHPYLPPGTIIALSERLPYPSNEVPAVFAVRTLSDYTAYDWALTTRAYSSGIYLHACLQCFFPAGSALLTNIGNG